MSDSDTEIDEYDPLPIVKKVKKLQDEKQKEIARQAIILAHDLGHFIGNQIYSSIYSQTMSEKQKERLHVELNNLMEILKRHPERRTEKVKQILSRIDDLTRIDHVRQNYCQKCGIKIESNTRQLCEKYECSR